MEIAIASTVISVASLASLFGTCITTLDTISSVVRFGVSHEILQVKIEIEKVRLLIWGQAVGLNDDLGDIDGAFERQYVRHAVASLLVCFTKFLEDTEQLRESYGLIESPANTDPLNPNSTGLDEDNVLGAIFKRTYDKFRHNPSRRQRETSLVTKAKWAIRDEGKFRLLVEELKGINDSLSSLLPGVKERTRVETRNEILRSTDAQQLQSIINASEDGNDFISEAASLRLDVISGRGTTGGRPSVFQPAQPIVIPSRPAVRPKTPQPEPQQQKKSSDTSALHGRNTAIGQVENIPSSQLKFSSPAQVKQIHRVPDVVRVSAPAPAPLLEPPYDNTGALTFHQVIAQENCPLFFVWMAGMEDIKISYQPRPLVHPSFELFRLPQKYLKHAKAVLEVDPECDPEYEGWAPGSVSLPGFAREIYWPMIMASSREVKIWARIDATPSVLTSDIIKRWNRIKDNDGKLERGWTKEKGYEQVRSLVGDSEYNWLDPDERYKIRHQITDLLASLSRPTVFPDFDTGRSLAMLEVQGAGTPRADYGIVGFMFQVLSAKELSLRLEQDDDAPWHGGITTKIIYDLIGADLYMTAMSVSLTGSLHTHSITKDTREQQRDAMLAFAEKMRWPYITEARHTLDDFVNGRDVALGLDAWGWIARLPLPGAYFSTTLLFGLIQCCRSLSNSLQTVRIRESSFGIVFPKVSYWRSRSILGKVLAPLDGVHDIGGWIGPCPPPLTGAPLEKFLFVKLKRRLVSFKFQDNAEIGKVAFSPSAIGGIAELANNSDDTWEEPVPPEPSREQCQLKATRVIPMPQDAIRGTNSTKMYQARLDFWLVRAKKAITFSLYANSMFIAAPPCRGTHRIDSRLKDHYAHRVLEPSNLDRASLSPNEITVINGGSGTGEVLARAWCAQMGTNAILWKRGSTCCFKCALMLASKEGLGVNVLIIT